MVVSTTFVCNLQSGRDKVILSLFWSTRNQWVFGKKEYITGSQQIWIQALRSEYARVLTTVGQNTCILNSDNFIQLVLISSSWYIYFLLMWLLCKEKSRKKFDWNKGHWKQNKLLIFMDYKPHIHIIWCLQHDCAKFTSWAYNLKCCLDMIVVWFLFSL